MATPASGSIQRVPSRLIWAPTNLGTTEPYGGTYLGTCRDLEFTPQPVLRPIWNEVSGTTKDVIYGGERVLFKAVVRYPDTDMISTAAFKSITGTSGIHWLFRPEGTTSNTRAGTSLGTRSGVLLVAARAPLAHPSLILYNAIPSFDETVKLQRSLGVEYGLSIVFHGTPDSSGRVYDEGFLADLSL